MTNNYEINNYEVIKIHYGAKRNEYIEVIFDDYHNDYEIDYNDTDYNYYEQEW